MTINQPKSYMLLLLCCVVVNAYAQFQPEDFQQSQGEPDLVAEELPTEPASPPFTSEPDPDDFLEQDFVDFELVPFEPVLLDEATPDAVDVLDNQTEREAAGLEAIDTLVPDTMQQSLDGIPEIDFIPGIDGIPEIDFIPGIDETLEKQASDALPQDSQPARKQSGRAGAKSATRRRLLPEFLRASKPTAKRSRNPGKDPVIQVRQRVQKIGIMQDEKTGEPKEVLLNTGLITAEDTLLFSMYCRNTSKTTAQQVVITYPLPESVFWLEGSTTGAYTSFFYSTDAGYSFVTFEQMLAGLENGEYLVLSEGVTHIRWVYNVPLRAGQSGVLTFRAKLASTFNEP